MGFGSGYVVGWGTLALINAALAQGKGQSGMNWSLASLASCPSRTPIVASKRLRYRQSGANRRQSGFKSSRHALSC